jgi:hypothetical protein
MVQLTAQQEWNKALWAQYDYWDYTLEGQRVAKTLYYSVGMMLGYPTPPNTSDPSLKITPATQGYPGNYGHLHELTQEILSLKVMLSQTLQDGMATQVGDLKLDLGTFSGNLKQQGSTKIAMLSQYTGLPVLVDMFTGRMTKTSSTPYSIRSIS